MIDAIIFSRDRAAQLDLLLRSIEARAPQLLSTVTVIYHPTNKWFEEGYFDCISEHPTVDFIDETDFRSCLKTALREIQDFVVFFCDDDLFVRNLGEREDPTKPLLENEQIYCFSLRLGLNTTYCYPLSWEQPLPDYKGEKVLSWEWRNAMLDFGYPASLDGHIFRIGDFRQLMGDERFDNPNLLEEMLHSRLRYVATPSLMACYPESVICGVPVNRVTETHANRYGERIHMDLIDLNDRFLDGARLQLRVIDPAEINAAHVEFPLVFQ